MRLKIRQLERNRHSDLVSVVGWAASNELFSCSDDSTIYRWDFNAEPSSKVFDLNNCAALDMSWLPPSRGVSELFAVACSDGSFKLISKSGREEKAVAEAHVGAVITLRWSHDGTTLATGGEDGLVKIWGRAGMLRSSFAQADHPVYCLSWSPTSDQLLFCSYNIIAIKPLQAGSKQRQWKAHEGCVQKADWNPSNGLIVSGGEDCKYKVWDAFGRNLFSSTPGDYVVTAVQWSPNGDLFAVGSFEVLRICDKTGWTYSLAKPKSGSINGISWSLDGTMLAGAGGNGAVVFGYIVDRKLSLENIEVQLHEDNVIKVIDVIHEISEELPFRDRVINLALGFEHLVVTTTTQCYVYSTQNWQVPHIFDIRESASLIVQSGKAFALVDINTGVQVFNYDGRMISNPKFSGLRVEFLSKRLLSLSDDVVAVVDTNNPKVVHLFDIASGKSSGDIEHGLEVIEVTLNQVERAAERKVCILDSNRDLTLRSVHRQDSVKLAAIVDTFSWNEHFDILAAITDGKLSVWYYPNVVFADKELLENTKMVKDVSAEVGKNSTIESFSGSLCTVRRVDGRVATLSCSPYPPLLFESAERDQWERAIRLCRFVKDPTLWYVLAAMALYRRELSTAEIALAATDEIDRVEFINYVKLIPSEAGRNAELALFSHRTQEAEQILLGAKLYYRAIKMNIKLFRWERALEIAISQKKHIDTVLAYRRRFLERSAREENIEKFKQLRETAVNWVDVKTKIKQDKESEAMNGRPYE